MKEIFKRIDGFIRAFNFCFGLMLLVFAASIGLTIYLHSLWYLLIAALTVAFYLAFYLVYIEMLNYYTVLDEQERIEEDVEDIKQLVQNLTKNIPVKEQVIDFTKVNNNK